MTDLSQRRFHTLTGTLATTLNRIITQYSFCLYSSPMEEVDTEEEERARQLLIRVISSESDSTGSDVADDQNVDEFYPIEPEDLVS